MKRNMLEPRDNWQQKVSDAGLPLGPDGQTWWEEGVHYEFTPAEITALDDAASDVMSMYKETLNKVMHDDRLLRDGFGVPDWFLRFLTKSWNDNAPSLVTRFDFCYDGQQPPVLLDIDANLPVGLMEAGRIQEEWFRDIWPDDETVTQHNGMHDKLKSAWTWVLGERPGAWVLDKNAHDNLVHFGTLPPEMSPEDYAVTRYLSSIAEEAGCEAVLLPLEEIGWNDAKKSFVDMEEREITNLHMQYPWFRMIHEQFGENVPLVANDMWWFEPAWKLIADDKRLLVHMYEMFSNSVHLLPTFAEQGVVGNSYARKPAVGRFGGGVTLVERGKGILTAPPSDLAQDGFVIPDVYQSLATLPGFDGNYPVVQMWAVGDDVAALSIRESNSLITNSPDPAVGPPRAVPHIVRSEPKRRSWFGGKK